MCIPWPLERGAAVAPEIKALEASRATMAAERLPVAIISNPSAFVPLVGDTVNRQCMCVCVCEGAPGGIFLDEYPSNIMCYLTGFDILDWMTMVWFH